MHHLIICRNGQKNFRAAHLISHTELERKQKQIKMKVKKKGTTGNAKNFVTRTQAIKRLQVSLADFRRLCIFKGIYPREPRNKKKANKGSTAPVTFYYAKDIQYLLHEPVLSKFREQKAFAKKLQKALGKGQVNDAQKLENNRPTYSLGHIVKERYPTFHDALRDLDDPLNMLFLFANLPATDKVSHRVTRDAEKLTNQWLAYIAKEKLLSKVFVSIKGVYYQAKVRGQEVTWLVPYKFPANIPSDVDFRIMLTFLEFYSTLLHFVLYRLYKEANLIYPPTIDIEKLKGVGGLASYILQSKEQGVNALLPQEKTQDVKNDKSIPETKLSDQEINKAIEADSTRAESEERGNDDLPNDDPQNDDDLDEFSSASKEKGDLLSQPSKDASLNSSLFSKFTFFVGREVPLDILEFTILSCGGSIVSEIALNALELEKPEEYKKLDFSSITHQIVDRPKLTARIPGRTYVQPQWVFDSINKGELQPVSSYAPGETLPPHLSPWGDVGGYNPEAQVEGPEEEDTTNISAVPQERENDTEVSDNAEESDSDKEDADVASQKEVELEAAGVKSLEASTDENPKERKSKKRPAEEEEKDLRKIMMTNKQRKLYNTMQYSNEKKASREKELAKKKKQISKAKNNLNKLE